ncbi:MAG TPA: S-adenosylmethionine:tRNA ribosyltransferase-isomerase, partial [Nocardioides sp.]|nr:S-adenosylmethionine:tRNA ribosyltransferase-isomerase [Nocardioides sp.]
MSLAATAPPEARGLARDEVRMAVVTSERTHHRQARELPLWLEPGDLLVVNTSATLPSALPG